MKNANNRTKIAVRNTDILTFRSVHTLCHQLGGGGDDKQGSYFFTI